MSAPSSSNPSRVDCRVVCVRAMFAVKLSGSSVAAAADDDDEDDDDDEGGWTRKRCCARDVMRSWMPSSADGRFSSDFPSTAEGSPETGMLS